MEKTEVGMVRVDCASCGTIFYIQKSLESVRRAGGQFCCPNGHALSYPGGPSKDELQKRVEELEAEVKRLKLENGRLIHKLDQASVTLDEE